MSGAIPVSALQGYALWAETWDDTPSPIAALEQRMLEPWIAELQARRAVDVGCGTGRWTGRLGGVGLDASKEMLRVAARKADLRGRLAVANASRLPIATGAADAVLSALMLGHVRRQETTMAEFARVLARGGQLLLTDFHPAAVARGWRRTFRDGGQVYELENHAYTVEQLREWAPELRLDRAVDASIGEPERELFARAGRPELFAAACEFPAVLLTRWTRV